VAEIHIAGRYATRRVLIGPPPGTPKAMTDQPNTPLQNDPDRANDSLVPDALGEFVRDQPGGAFDPRAFRSDPPAGSGDDLGPVHTADDDEPGGPPANGLRMSGPGEEIDKTR
jgi:hypothetical protein